MYILFDLRQRAVKYMVSKLLNKYETFSGMGHGAEGGGGFISFVIRQFIYRNFDRCYRWKTFSPLYHRVAHKLLQFFVTLQD